MAWSSEQLANARVIAQVGRSMGASQRDIQIALMTALQESTLRNLNYGDRDSLGLFQQRPSQGWGSASQVRDPQYASRKFYESLLKDGGRNSRSLTQAAQRVQRSAFPDAYAKHEGSAADILAQIGEGGATPAPLPTAGVPGQPVDPGFSDRPVGVEAPVAVGTEAPDRRSTMQAELVSGPPQRTEGDAFMPTLTQGDYTNIASGGQGSGRGAQVVAYAKRFLGTPYKWGGTGPLGFDCSGLLQYVFKNAAGVNLPRISAAQAAAGPRVGLDQLQPGDLVAWDNSSRNNGADHIALYIGNGQVLHAPRPGDSVKISALWDQQRAWGVRMNL